MTRKDFELIAAAFRLAFNENKGVGEARGIAIALAYVTTALGTTNDQFDRKRFLAAADPEVDTSTDTG